MKPDALFNAFLHLNIYYMYNISIRSQLTTLSIDIFAFKMTKLRAV